MGHTKTNRTLNLLLISPSQEDQDSACRILTEPLCSVRRARNSQEARSILRTSEVDIVVLVDCEPAEGPIWYEVVSQIEDVLGFQPVVVTSMAADGRLWEEVLTGVCPDLVTQALDLKERLHAPTITGRHRAPEGSAAALVTA